MMNIDEDRNEQPRRQLAYIVQMSLLSAALLLWLPGCFVSPPIEPLDPELNYPPYIDPVFVRPTQEVIRVDTPEIQRLSVETFLDPNREDVLYYAWIGERLGLIEQSGVGPSPDQTELFKGIFYQFGRSEVEIDPCAPELRDVESETIWIYVADRRFVRITGDGVEVEEGGFMDAHAWLLKFGPRLCFQN
ncbi:MAG: hypothetical protein ACNA8W_03080 [Bradymonadaceae bacterium]